MQIDQDFERKKTDFLNSIKLSKLEIEDYERTTANTIKRDLCIANRVKWCLGASKFYIACKINPTTSSRRLMREVIHKFKEKNLIVDGDVENDWSVMISNSY